MSHLIAEAFQYVFPTIERCAPLIANLLGQPWSTAAHVVISLLTEAFGGNANDYGSLSQSINNDPNTEQKLQDLEAKYSDLLQKLIDQRNQEKDNVNVTVNINHSPSSQQ